MATARWRKSAVVLIACVGSFSIFSCSDASRRREQASPKEEPPLATVTQALVDGCTTAKRTECTGKSCGCMNNHCSGGSCDPVWDGCTTAQRASCDAMGCGCVNGSCSAGACEPQSDWCSDTKAQSCTGFACGCYNESCSGGACSLGDLSPPLTIPPVLKPTSGADPNTDYYQMLIKTSTAQMRVSGNPTTIVGFNGIFPGPTIVAKTGKNPNGTSARRPVQLTHTNIFDGTVAGFKDNNVNGSRVSVHNHGHKVLASSDGHPTDYINVGGSKIYTYPNDQRAGTYWYHDHTMHVTGAHVYYGLAGFYIIRDVAEETLNCSATRTNNCLPTGKYDVPLLIQDKSLDGNNALVYTKAVFPGQMGDLAVVNGAIVPHLNVDTHKYRFRILNGADARIFNLKVKVGPVFGQFQVIGTDGGLLDKPTPVVTELRVAPAERYDIIVDFAGLPNGQKVRLTNTDPSFPQISTLMEFRVTRQVADNAALPSTFSTIPRLSNAVANTDLRFDFLNGAWTINETTYSEANPPAATSTIGQVYTWTLKNNLTSQFPHPFHKHMSHFQILDVNGQGAPPPTSPLYGWKDTVLVQPGQVVKIIFKNEPVPAAPPGSFPGTYVFHCHNLEHEDMAMMLEERIVQ
jgi:spore coat protein A, manganese oxidase